MEKIINNIPNGCAEVRNIITDSKCYIYKRVLLSFGLTIADFITGGSYNPIWKELYYSSKDIHKYHVTF